MINGTCAPDPELEEAVLLFLTAIVHITQAVGKFTSDLHPVIAHWLSCDQNYFKSIFFRKLVSPIEMDNGMINFINQCKDSIESTSISCCVDQTSILSSHLARNVCLENIRSLVVVSHFKNGSFFKFMMQTYY